MLVVSDDAADRLRVTEMAVGAQDTAAHAAVLHAARHLLLGALVVLAENSRFCHHALRHALAMHRAAQCHGYKLTQFEEAARKYGVTMPDDSEFARARLRLITPRSD